MFGSGIVVRSKYHKSGMTARLTTLGFGIAARPKYLGFGKELSGELKINTLCKV
jgi:hypothetical protein